MLRGHIGQLARQFNRLQPLFFSLKNFQQTALGFIFKRGTNQFVENFLSPVKQTGLQIILPLFGERMQTNAIIEIGTIDQILVHADGALSLATPAKKIAKRKVQFNGLGIDLRHFEKRVDGLVGLLVEQEIEPLKIGAWQGAGLMNHLPHINASSSPTQ